MKKSKFNLLYEQYMDEFQSYEKYPEVAPEVDDCPNGDPIVVFEADYQGYKINVLQDADVFYAEVYDPKTNNCIGNFGDFQNSEEAELKAKEWIDALNAEREQYGLNR